MRTDSIVRMEVDNTANHHPRPPARSPVPAHDRDARQYHTAVTASSIPRSSGRPIARPKEILADTAAIRDRNRRRGIETVIPVNRRKRTNPRCERPYRFDHQHHGKRTDGARFLSGLGACRKITPRNERKDESDRG
jgi:hypothetical protein